MESPWPTLVLCGAYLTMCYWGPRVMAAREPFQLRPLIILYNLAMVLLSAYMCYEVSPFALSLLMLSHTAHAHTCTLLYISIISVDIYNKWYIGCEPQTKQHFLANTLNLGISRIIIILHCA